MGAVPNKAKKERLPLCQKKTSRQLNNQWRKYTKHKGRHKTKLLYIDNLFDVGINMDYLTGDGACFYTDQLCSRCGRISEDIDLKYVAEKQTELKLAAVTLK